MKLATCPACGSQFDVSTFTSGFRFRCAKCKGVCTTPADSAAAPPPPAAVPVPAPPPAPAPSPVPAVSRPAAAAPAPAVLASRASEDLEAAYFPADAPTRPEPPPRTAAPAARPAAKAPAHAIRPPAGAAAGPAPAATPPVPRRATGTPPGGSRALGGGRAAGRAGATPPHGSRSLHAREGRAAAGRPGDANAPNSKRLLFIGLAGAAFLVAGLVYAFLPGGNPANTKTKADAPTTPADEYKSRLAGLDAHNVAQVLDLAAWCERNGLQKEQEELLEKAAKIDAKAAKPALLALLARRRSGILPDDASAHWTLVEWCVKNGLADEADKLTDLVLKINPNHAGANKRYDRELYKGHWEPRDMIAVLAAQEKAFKNEADMLAKMTPREREVYGKEKELRGEFGVGVGGPDIEFLDAKPYLLCLQKSKKYASDLRLSDFSEITAHLFKAFYQMYAEKFELKDMKESVVIIFVFEDREAYVKYGETIGLPPYAGGHYEQSTKKRLMIYNDLSDPYETIFHEGMHQLVDFATMAKGKKDKNMFWFTEGVATYFEVFRRDPKEGFILGEVARNSYLPKIKEAIRHNFFLPLPRLIQRYYPEVVMEALRDPTGIKIDIYYAESWSLVHFFYKYQDGKYRSRFEDYFKKEIFGQGGEETFKAILGDPKDLQKEWLEFIKDLK